MRLTVSSRSSSVRRRTLLCVDRLLALVVPAARAHAVRLLGFVAVRALRERGRRQRVVRAALVASGLAVSPLGIRHGLLHFLLEGLEGLPAGIDGLGRARARSEVPVLEIGRATCRDRGATSVEER